MTEDYLDSECEYIFTSLLHLDQPINFNKLFKWLKDIGHKTSKPTLITHLNHLQKKKLIKRKREGKQRVTYSINYNDADKLREEYKSIHEYLIEEEKTFKTTDIQRQVLYVALISTLSDLKRMKYAIKAIQEPKRRFEYVLSYYFISDYLERFTKYLLRECKNPTIAQQVITEIENAEKNLEKELLP